MIRRKWRIRFYGSWIDEAKRIVFEKLNICQVDKGKGKDIWIDTTAYAEWMCKLAATVGWLQGQGAGQDCRRIRWTATEDPGFYPDGQCFLNQSLYAWNAEWWRREKSMSWGRKISTVVEHSDEGENISEWVTDHSAIQRGCWDCKL